MRTGKIRMVERDVPQNSVQITVTCPCGYEIPVTPDASTLGIVIDRHIEEHVSQMKDPQTAIVTSENVSNQIFKTLFLKISNL